MNNNVLKQNILIITVIVLITVIACLLLNPIEREIYASIPDRKLELKEAKNGIKTTVLTAVVPTKDLNGSISKENQNYLKDSLQTAIDENLGYKAKIKDLTVLNNQLIGRLNKSNLKIDSLNKSLYTWKDNYIEIKADIDSGNVDYKYKGKIYLATVFNPKNKNYFDIVATSPDKNFTINGVEKYIQAEKIPREWIDWTLGFELGKNSLNKNLLRYQIRSDFMFFPDGFVRPYVFGLIEVNNNNLINENKFFEYGAGFKIKLLRK